MIRTQISLTEDQVDRLRRASRRRRMSMAAVIRDAIDRVVGPDEPSREATWDRALAAMGRFASAGDGNVSEEHDRFLDEIYGQQ
jgi:hypothetical protein